MFAAAQTRAPSWLGLSPGLPTPAAVGPAVAKAVLGALGQRGTLTGLRFDHGTVEQFRFDPADGGPALFVRLGHGRRRALQLKRAAAVGRWLAARGVAAVAALRDFPRQIDEERWLVAAPYVDGRRLRATEADLALLGGTLRRLHAALAEHPSAPVWRRNTLRRLSTLEATRHHLAAGARAAGPEPAALRRLAQAAAGWPPGHDDGHPTPLHGDLNMGNLLAGGRPRAIVLFDFEDVFHSVLPPVVDLARCLERAVLVRVRDDERALRLGRTLIDAYRAGGGTVPAGSDLSMVLRALSLQSLCILAALTWRGMPSAEAEWRKFFTLERAARRRSELLRAIAR